MVGILGLPNGNLRFLDFRGVRREIQGGGKMNGFQLLSITTSQELLIRKNELVPIELSSSIQSFAWFWKEVALHWVSGALSLTLGSCVTLNKLLASVALISADVNGDNKSCCT